MKRLWIYLVGLLLLTACSDDTPDVPELKGRTMLAYLVSNNRGGDLDKYLKYNLVDMYKGLSHSKDKKTLMVYYRPKASDISLSGPSILKFEADGKGKINGETPIPSDLLQIDKYFDNVSRVADRVIKQAEITASTSQNEVATDPDVMTTVLKKMVEMAPAGSYGLIMGSHASGWLEAYKTHGRSFGDDAGYSINIPELADVFRDAFAGQKLDFLIFDACMMANAEVAYELRDVVNYVVASALETTVYGFPYARFFDALYKENVDYQVVCDEFVNFNKSLIDYDGYPYGWATVAAINCKKMPKLAEWMKVALKRHASEINRDLARKVFQYGAGSFANYSYDIVDLFENLEGGKPADLLQLMDEVVVAKNCLEGEDYQFGGIVIDKDRFCGMGMYLPYLEGNQKWDTYYMSSYEWPQAIEWNYK